MNTEIILALLSLVGTLAGSLLGVLTSTRLTVYRIEQLEKKVEGYNSVIERVALLERDNTTQWQRIDEMRTDIKDIKREVMKNSAKIGEVIHD